MCENVFVKFVCSPEHLIYSHVGIFYTEFYLIKSKNQNKMLQRSTVKEVRNTIAAPLKIVLYITKKPLDLSINQSKLVIGLRGVVNSKSTCRWQSVNGYKAKFMSCVMMVPPKFCIYSNACQLTRRPGHLWPPIRKI